MDIQTLMASTVHDVKNSLGLIDGQLNDIVKRVEVNDPESAHEIRRIQLECGRINNGMVHMLGLYKVSLGNFGPLIEEVWVNDVVANVTARFTELLADLDIELQVDTSEFEDLWYMDANLIEGLLSNVLTNSIRYTKSKLTFKVREHDGWLNIRMMDDGPGFPEAMQKLVDQPEAVCFQSGATGLGLFFCKKIAEMHVNEDRVGYVELTNHPDTGGAVFDLWLP